MKERKKNTEILPYIHIKELNITIYLYVAKYLLESFTYNLQKIYGYTAKRNDVFLLISILCMFFSMDAFL